MIEHTPGALDVYAQQDGFFVVPHQKPSGKDVAGNYSLLAAGHEVPHECADPQCPGDVNRRKLDAFDGLLAAMEKFTDEVETLHRTLGPHHCTAASCPDIDAAHAAIASAQEHTAPGAEAPRAGTGSEVSTD